MQIEELVREAAENGQLVTLGMDRKSKTFVVRVDGHMPVESISVADVLKGGYTGLTETKELRPDQYANLSRQLFSK